MGFESFRVELHSAAIKFGELESAIQSLPNIKRDQNSIQMKGSRYYVVDDGRHVIELELTESPARISCRFTLCHPSSVDAAFLELIGELMAQTGLEARICDDVKEANARPFSLVNFSDFKEVAKRCIAARRAEWIAAFGDRPMPATTSEVHERIILPRCEPRIEQPN